MGGDEKGELTVKAGLQLEGSGHIDLRFSTDLRADAPDNLKAEVDIKNQDLETLTSFFRPNAGVSLTGKMLTGKGQVTVTGKKLDAKVTTTFKGFEITLEKMHDRSEASAFLINLGLEIDAKRENLDDPSDEKTRRVSLTREPKERLVGFALRGLKEAALKVARAD